MNLNQLSCEACKGNVDQITAKEVKEFSKNIPQWELITSDNVDKLKRVFLFNNFQDAWIFANQVAAIAETENHHPEILLEWGRCTVIWWTHKSKGLHIFDFICAAKTDLLLVKFD
jgi:4a-hydroxytetrahydrobiopterin dehydratase